MTDKADAIESQLDDRLESIGWGLLFIVTGLLIWMPGDQWNQWLVICGAILLGLNGARIVAGIQLNWFSTVLGLAGVVTGGTALAGRDIPFIPLVLILIGGLTIVATLARAIRREDPRARQSMERPI